MRIILLNGPPSSGKDTIARRVVAEARAEGVYVREMKFATALKEAAAKLFPGIRWGLVGESDRTAPNVPHVTLHGVTPRQVLIDLSERFFKPTFGADYFGRRAAEQVEQAEREGAAGVVISDSGFIEEAMPLIEEYHGRIAALHLYRTGCTFDGDSRYYLPQTHGLLLDTAENETLDDIEAIAGWCSTWIQCGGDEIAPRDGRR
jgi:hypothetical protein